MHRLNQSPHGEEAPTGPRKARPDDRLRAVSSQWRWNETGVEPGNFPVLQNGAPDTIRTCDLCLRRATLYPAELRVRWGSFSPLAGDRQRAGGSFFGKGHAFESCRVRQEAVCGACRDCGDPLLPRQKSAETAAKESLWSTRPTRRLCFKAVAHLFASLSGRWLRGALVWRIQKILSRSNGSFAGVWHFGTDIFKHAFENQGARLAHQSGCAI